MKSNSIFTRQRMGLDNSVWMMLFLCVVLSFGLLGYNMINKDKERPCVETIKIYVGGRIDNEKFPAKAGQSVSFMSPLMAPGDRIVWDFRDETPKAEGNSVTHIFARKGIYNVVATINGRCEFTKRVIVDPALQVVAGEPSQHLEEIIGSDHAIAGENVAFTTTLDAKNYEWFLDRIKSTSKSGKDVSFKFTKQQDYIVVLRLDHDINKTYRKKVTVSIVGDQNEKPFNLGGIPVPTNLTHLPKNDSVAVTPKVDPKNVEPENKKTKINDANLKEYMQAQFCNVMTIEAMQEYLCDGLETKVLANGKQTTFGQLRANVQGQKFFVDSVTAVRDCRDGAISSITITFATRGKFAKWVTGLKDPCPKPKK